MDGIWRDIPGYEGYYQASKSGEIRSVSHYRKGRQGMYLQKSVTRKPYKNKNGYLVVNLSKEGKIKTFKVHRLIAMTFINNPFSKNTVNHIDGNKLNNSVQNLEWATEREQAIHRHGVLNVKYSDCKACHKKNMKKVRRSDGKIFNSIKEAMEELGVIKSNIGEVCKGKYKTCYGYNWEFIKECDYQ